MKGRETLLALLGVILLGVGALLVWRSHGPMRDFVLDDGCYSPVRILEPRAPQIGSAVVYHGLSANRRMMQTFGQWLAALGLRVYLVDLPGHGDSATPFSLAHADQCGAAAFNSLVSRGMIVPERTIVAGHSMGGAIAIRLADRIPAAATIAIAPAPMASPEHSLGEFVPFEMPRRMPVNLLILRGAWDLPKFAGGDTALIRAAGGERVQPEDFRQRRAAKLVVVPRATHTSILYDPRQRSWSLDWARNALNVASPRNIEFPGAPVLGGLLGVAGMLLLFPAAASFLTAMLKAAPEKTARSAKEGDRISLGLGTMLLWWALASLISVVFLKLWGPFTVLSSYGGPYLASFYLVAGVILLARLSFSAKLAAGLKLRPVVMACALGLATLLAFSAWLNWQLLGASVDGARRQQFIPALLFFLPYFLAEEWALGPLEELHGWRRLAVFFAMRFTQWLALIGALFILRSEDILILLLALYLALFSALQRWGSDAVRRRTGSLAAAAVFGAILAAWFVAAVFPLA